MTFNDRDYTYDSIMKHLVASEDHCRDGSALEAGCKCIETKHLFGLEIKSEEGSAFALSEKEKKFFAESAELYRAIRKKMEHEDWDLEGALHDSGLNPGHRAYLPHGLSEGEKSDLVLRHKLAHCIRNVEKREGCKPPYEGCPVNPVAVCRASLEG